MCSQINKQKFPHFLVSMDKQKGGFFFFIREYIGGIIIVDLSTK